MSFAATLKRVTNQAQDSFIQEVNATIDRFVTEVSAGLQDECLVRAERGYSDHEFSVERKVDDLWEHKVHGTELSAAQRIQASLQAHVAGLGFDSAAVVVHGQYRRHNGWNWEDLNPLARSKEQLYRFLIILSWEDVQCVEDDQESGVLSATGATMQCPICYETGPAVALVPCGHTVCRGCAGTLRSQPCPCCRRSVISSTDGLFLG